jgi:hypothetical protein
VHGDVGHAPLRPPAARAARPRRLLLPRLGIRLNLPVVGGDQAWEALRPGVDVHPLR